MTTDAIKTILEKFGKSLINNDYGDLRNPRQKLESALQEIHEHVSSVERVAFLQGEENGIRRGESAELLDEVRDAYVCAILQGLSTTGNSADVANYVWDVAQRLMSKRDQNAPIVERTPVPPVPEGGDVQILHSDAEIDDKPVLPIATASEVVQDFWNTKEQVAEPDPAPVKRWGDGSTFTDKVQENEPDQEGPEERFPATDHDDGPF